MWPTGVAPWKGGVFVAAPPDIWYFKDTDGDHVTDVRRKVFTGFGTENEQGGVNNLTFGLDHKIYGSSSHNGGKVRRADDPKAPTVDIEHADFRFDPETLVFEAVTGTIQFGTTFDDFGNRFLCSESRPLLHAVLPLENLSRNPYLPVPQAISNVAGNPVPIHRISPLERWRQIRSSRRIAHGERSAESAGASHHVVERGGRSHDLPGHRLPRGLPRQCLRRRRAEQPDPPDEAHVRRPDVQGDERRRRLGVRPLVGQLVPPREPRQARPTARSTPST